MSQDKPTEKPPTFEWAEGCDRYIEAFLNAMRELENIEAKEKEFAYRKAILSDTVTALRPLIFKRAWDISDLSLTDAIRWIFKGSKRPLSALDVRTKLTDLGYNLEQFDNPLANIHTALTRMGETNEITKIESEGKKKTFEPTSELKSVPEPTPDISALSEALKTLGPPQGQTE